MTAIDKIVLMEQELTAGKQRVNDAIILQEKER